MVEHRPEENVGRQGVHCVKRKVTCSVNTRPRRRRTFSAVGCGRMWEVKEEERKRKANEEEEAAKTGTSEFGRGRRRFDVDSR